MSDALLERIASALEKIAASGGASTPAATQNKNVKPGATATGSTPPKTSPAAGPKTQQQPPKNAATAKAQSGPKTKHTFDEVTNALRELAKQGDQSKELARTILKEHGGVSKMSELKPENFDAVFEAINAETGDGDSGAEGDDLLG